ncbi:MAG: GGDEF domain-containing protein [Arcobacteraceae bacterium]|nr:GGDEF domain-containing protein [Arcobacteraceae bacterium]
MVLVKNILSTQNVSISQYSTIKEAVEILGNSSEEAIVILDTDDKPICTFTERDLIKVLTNKIDLSRPILEITRKNIITVNHNRTLEYALNVLIDNNIRRVVAVDDEDKFIGIASQKHIIKYIEEESFKTNILVSNIISQKLNLITINQNKTVNEAVSLMAQYEISSVLITDNQNTTIGLFTEKDVVHISSSNKSLSTPLYEVCSFDLQTVRHDDNLKDVVDIMSKKDISIALVLDSQNNPTSILSTRDIAHNIKGNYNKFLETRLKGVKSTLNYIGELIIEVCSDNNKQIIQWINEASINRFGHQIIDKEISSVIGIEEWCNIYTEIRTNQKYTKKKIQIDEYFYEMICSYHFISNKETILMILRDVTDYEDRVTCEVLKREEKEKELALLQNVINQQSSLIIVSNGTKIELVNQSFLDFYDVSSPTQFHKSYNCICDTFVAHPSFFHLTPDDKNWIDTILQLPEKDRVVSIVNLKTIEPKAFSVQINNLLPNSNRFVITLTDITDIKLESQKHYYHATHDTLTKIYNRSFFLDKLNDEITASSRYKTPFSLVIFDIDYFKKFNDTYGHLKGDEVLVSVCEVVNLNIRKTDIFARWGGEEFVILLPHTTIQKAEILAENLRKLIEKISLDKINNITASFGISEYTQGDTEKTLIQKSDECLYRAKANGRNQVVI